MSAGTLQSRNLGRWFEQLCRIRHDSLRGTSVSTSTRIASGRLPHEGGVYALWWTGPQILRDQAIRSIALHGPAGPAVMIRVPRWPNTRLSRPTLRFRRPSGRRESVEGWDLLDTRQ